MFKKLVSLLLLAVFPVVFGAYNPPSPTTTNALAKYSNTKGAQANTGITVDSSNNLLTPANITLSLGNILLSGVSATVTSPLLIASTSVSTPLITTASGNLSISASGTSIGFNSKNFTSVGTIGSGAITSTGAIQGTTLTGTTSVSTPLITSSGFITLTPTSSAVIITAGKSLLVDQILQSGVGGIVNVEGVLLGNNTVTTDYAYVGGLEGNDGSNTLVISANAAGNTGTLNFNHDLVNQARLTIGSDIYSTGTASQTGTNITIAGGTLSNAMVPAVLRFANGTIATITKRGGGFSDLTAVESQTIGSQAYQLFYGGIQSAESGYFTAKALVTPTIQAPRTLTIITDDGVIDINTNSLTNVGTIGSGAITSTSTVQGTTLTGTTSVTSANVYATNIDNLTSDGAVAFTHGSKTFRPIVTQSADYTLALTDANTFQDCTKASAQVVTIPLNATVAFPIGTEIDFMWDGAGQVSFTATGGVTLRSVLSNTKIANQYGTATLKQIATNVWVLTGALVV